MDDKTRVENPLIATIFKTMAYGDDEENVDEATEWLRSKNSCLFAYVDKPTENPSGEMLSLKFSYSEQILCKVYIPETVTIENIIKKMGDGKNKWIDVSPTRRTELMQKFAGEIEKKQNLVAQLELAARGIPSKDTRNKSLTLLTDCLQFYSSFTSHCNDKSSSKPQGLVVGIISDKNCLSVLGYVLGPSLACGYNIVLQTDTRLSVVTSFIIDLAVQVGIPEGTIRLIPGHTVDPSVFCTNSQVSTISIFDNLYKDKYLIVNHFSKKFLHFHSSGIPMIVFDNCDLDSACQTAIQGAWSHGGALPWSVRTILIQESVFDNFVAKLKTTVDRLSVHTSNKKNLDIALPSQEVLEQLHVLTARAKNDGVSVYPTDPKKYPTFLIGGSLFNNNVLKEETVDVPLVTLTAFRTINEAVALANNTRQGLAASVWTESTSLAQEVARKLKVANVWINSHGLFAAELSNSPFKSSGNGHFGGKSGLLEHFLSKVLKSEGFTLTPNGEMMEKAIAEATKAQQAWSGLDNFERIKKMQKVALEISTQKTSLPEKWINEWVETIHDAITNSKSGGVTVCRNFNIVSHQEPCGTVAMEMLEDVATHNKKLLIAALLQGNSVIILNDSKGATALYSSMAAVLPRGVLTVLPSSQHAVKVAALHKALARYFGEKSNTTFSSLPLKSSGKFKVVSSDDWDEVYKEVSLSKNVWFNVGQSVI